MLLPNETIPLPEIIIYISTSCCWCSRRGEGEVTRAVGESKRLRDSRNPVPLLSTVVDVAVYLASSSLSWHGLISARGASSESE